VSPIGHCELYADFVTRPHPSLRPIFEVAHRVTVSIHPFPLVPSSAYSGLSSLPHKSVPEVYFYVIKVMHDGVYI